LSALLLYLVVVCAILWAWDRWVQPLTLGAALALLLLPLVFTGGAMLTGRIYAPADLPYMSEPLQAYRADFGIGEIHNGTLTDLYQQQIPWRQAVRWAIGRGEWPLLNPFMLCGDILAAAAQTAPYDPFNLVSLIIPLGASLTFAAAITFFLAGFGAFVFARALRCSEVAALVAATGWMYCGVMAFFVGWPIARAWAILPLILFGVWRVVHQRSRVVLTIAFVLEILAGHPETLLHVAALGAVYGVFEMVMKRGGLKPVVHAVAAGAIALGLTAIFLLPFLEAAPQTAEHETRSGVYASTPYPPMPEVTKRRVLNMLVPFYGGQPWRRDAISSEWDPDTARAGSVILAMALVALAVAPRRRETWFFFVSAVLCAWAGADAPPVSQILHALPLFDIAINHRFVYAAACFLSILAAIGVDAIAARPRAAAAIVIALAGALAVLNAVVSPGQLKLGIPANVIRLNVFAELVPLLAIFVLFVRRAPLVAPAILALLLVQRTVEDGGMYPAISQRAFYPRIPIVDAVPHSAEPFRIAGAHYVLIPDTAALYGLEDVRGYEAMTNKRLVDTYPLWCRPQAVSFNAIGDLTKPFLSFLNIRYLFAPPDTLPPHPWKLIATDKGGKLFENVDALPRAFVPPRIRYEPNSTSILKQMFEAPEFAGVAWIEAREYRPHEIANGPGKVTVRQAKLGFEMDAEMENDGWIVVSQTAWTGWRAYLDGKRVEMKYANHAFLGLFVPRGRHHVRLTYLPDAFTRGRAISFASLGALIVIALTRAAIRAKGRAPRPSA
jgi:Bacterial membrane protein YfhO